MNHSVIAGYAKRRDCLKRREQAQQRVTARVDDKLVEQRATEVAVGKGDAVRVIDTFIKGFEAALEEGRVRMDNPAEFNTMLRLKEFLLGGPDARQEVHASCPSTPRRATSTGPSPNCTDTAATRAMTRIALTILSPTTEVESRTS